MQNAVDPSAIAAAALDYAGRGWRVVPLFGVRDRGEECEPRFVCECGKENCKGSRGKHPRLHNWQEHATAVAEHVEQWCEAYPGMNLGVQLGPLSGIIDVEFDGDEGRATADKLLAECFTPTFQSGRSVHRIFKWSEALPNKQKVLVAGLEVRIGGDNKGTQTVFPPSRHWSGAAYRWLPGLDPGEVDVQPVPEALLMMMTNDPAGCALPGLDADAGESVSAKGREHWDRITAGVTEGGDGGPGRNESAASLCGKLLRNLARIDNDEGLEVVWRMVCAWNAQNRPPLDDNELRTTYTSILRKERERRAHEQIETALPHTPAEQEQHATGYVVGNKKDFSKSRIVIIDADPPIVQVFSSRFAEAKDGRIEIPLADLLSPRAVQRAALAQARYLLPLFSENAWHKHIRPLIESAEVIEPPPEATRDGAVAARLLDVLMRSSGTDGSAVKENFKTIRTRISNGEPGFVTDRDLALLLSRVGATRVREGDQRKWVFEKSTIEKIRQLAGL